MDGKKTNSQNTLKLSIFLSIVLVVVPVGIFIKLQKRNIRLHSSTSEVSNSPIISVEFEGNINGKPIPIMPSHGDLWFSTWAKNGNLYTTWGDGKGFGNILSDVGVAKLTGNLPNLSGQNIYNETHPTDLLDNDKPSSLLAIGNRLYGHFFSPLAEPWIGYNAYSDDDGKTWTRVGFYKQGEKAPVDASPWTETNNSNFRCLSFANMGQDYSLNKDGYVYGYGLPQPGRWNGGVYLTRVPTAKILDYLSYEYFAGIDNNANPVWSKSQTKAKEVPGITTKSQVSIIYHPGVGKYLLMTQEDVYQSDTPWGTVVISGKLESSNKAQLGRRLSTRHNIKRHG